MKMLLVSEGPADVGSLRDLPGENPDRGERLGAVTVLVRRVLTENLGVSESDLTIERGYLARVHERSDRVSTYERKIRLAIVEATTRNCTCVSVVIDRDGERNSSRLGQMRGGVKAAEQEGLALAYRTALGVAIETVEAWLLSDESAINNALNPDPIQNACAPEKLSGKAGTAEHPKARFLGAVGRARRPRDAPHDAVARLIRLELLEQRCPLGFAPYLKELRLLARAQEPS